jgi:hypothetical protein
MGKSIPALAALGLIILSGRAEASVVIDIAQDGSDVVATGAGALNLTGLASSGSAIFFAQIDSAAGVAMVGPAEFFSPTPTIDAYTGISGPLSFGTSGTFFPSSGSGDFFGPWMQPFGIPLLFVPAGYASESPLSGYSTYDGETLASMGLTPGQYVYTWGNGVSADSLTINIGGTVPEAPTWAMMIASVGLLGALYRRRAAAAA